MSQPLNLASQTDSGRRINGPEFRLTATADYLAPVGPLKIASHPTAAAARTASPDVTIARRFADRCFIASVSASPFEESTETKDKIICAKTVSSTKLLKYSRP